MKTRNALLKILIFFAGLFQSYFAAAAWIGQAEAETIALRWADRQWPERSGGAGIKNTMPESTGRAPRLYLVNLAGGGYVIVGGNDGARPVLGYSPYGEIKEGGTSPAFGLILASYGQQVEAAARAAGQDAEIRSLWSELRGPAAGAKVAAESVGPLLARDGKVNAWGQEAPYNKFAPPEGGRPTHAGCGAVSMAQIMWFWKHPRRGAGAHDGVDFSSAVYDWDPMPRSLSASSSAAEIDAVALALRHAGASIGTRYHAGGQPSLAAQANIDDALRANFHYNAEYRDNFSGPAGLKESAAAIKEELDNIPDPGIPQKYTGRLVQFNALKPAGHAFVCDGYENRGAPGDAPHKFYFHFNFGWEGVDDGYFLLSALGPVHGGEITFLPNYKINYRIFPVE